MIVIRAPKTSEEFMQYFQLRWKILRKPWLQPMGSEKDGLEQQAIHRAVFNESNEILAVARLHIENNTVGFIRYMAVNSSMQRKGLGKKLMLELEQEAEKRNIAKICLNAREQALPFYFSLGYNDCGLAHLLYGQVQHIKMEKELKLKAQNELVSQLVNTWYQTIPMSKAMIMKVCSYNSKHLLTTCDVNFNKNLHNTMFAGSIYTVATLTGWGWVYLQLQESRIEGDIVLADANIRYLAPIYDLAHGQVLKENVVGDTIELQQKPRVRFNIKVQILSGEMIAAEFSGQYVVKKKGKL